MRALLATICFFLFSIAGAPARTIEFAAAPQPDDALIVAVDDLAALDRLEPVIGEAAVASLRRAAARAGFRAAAGETQSLFTGAERFGEIHLVGVGRTPLKARDLEDFGGQAGKLARSSKAPRVAVIAPMDEAADLVDAAFGAALGQYSFDRYKSAARQRDGALAFIAADPAAARTLWNSGRSHVAASVIWARDMQTEPANVVYPEEFVVRARDLLRGAPNVSITVLDVPAMQRLGMNALLSVGHGSARPSRLLIVEYRGGPSGAAPVALVGKGITFDSGGISIKGNAGMWQMKADMTGAAVVTAAVAGLAKSRAPVNVVALAALAENMPSGTASRPGDVVRAMSGTTIEIMSTDAEGRMVLADAVWYAQERFKPSLLVDVATLTGSIGAALSDEYAGLFVRDDAVAARLLAAGEASGEDLWRMPLHPNYYRQIRSDIADIKNGDAGSPGHGAGAAFIGTFVKEETPWAHLDIAGVDHITDSTPTVPKGFSGFGVRLLDRLARDGAVQ